MEERMKKLSQFDVEDGRITGPERMALGCAKKALTASRSFAGDDQHLWSIK